MALEKEMNKDPLAFRHLTITFDGSSNFLIYPSLLGIKVYNIVNDEVVREIGKVENIRFLGVTLCRAVPSITERHQGAVTSIRKHCIGYSWCDNNIRQFRGGSSRKSQP
jgi:peptidylprolyl isomerase domain and WD repeat-containing protein 1